VLDTWHSGADGKSVSIHFSQLAIPLIGARTNEHLTEALGGTLNAEQ
jgi:hypothetical protein